MEETELRIGEVASRTGVSIDTLRYYSVVWDYVAVYQPGKLWDQAQPEPAYSKVPVIRGIDGTREAIQKLSRENFK